MELVQQTLNRTERLVFLLHYADGLSLAEVSAVLDVPVETVEASLDRLHSRARSIASGDSLNAAVA